MTWTGAYTATSAARRLDDNRNAQARKIGATIRIRKRYFAGWGNKMSDIVAVNTDVLTQVFAGLIEQKQWCAWRIDEVGEGRMAKVPYCGERSRAQSSDIGTWRTFQVASTLYQNPELNMKGVGIFLGKIPGGKFLFGIDLDTCRDRDTGIIEQWALKFLDDFKTYAEVSPSGTGVKLFGLMDAALYEEALGLVRFTPHGPTDTVRTGTHWKRGTGAHPQGIELYVANRYFAVTGKVVGEHGLLRSFESTELLGLLVGTVGPAFRLGQMMFDKITTLGFNLPQPVRSEFKSAFDIRKEPHRDKSRSGYEFKIACALARSNVAQSRPGSGHIYFSKEEFIEIISEWPTCGGRILNAAGQPIAGRVREANSTWANALKMADSTATDVLSGVLSRLDPSVAVYVEELAQMTPREYSQTRSGDAEHLDVELGQLEIWVKARRGEIGRQRRAECDGIPVQDITQALDLMEQWLVDVRYNTRMNALEILRCPEFQEDGTAGAIGEFPRLWSDNDLAQVRFMVAEQGYLVGNELAQDAMRAWMIRNQSDPVRDWFETLEWDGTLRLPNMPRDVLGVEVDDANRKYVEQVFWKWMLAAVRRTYRPGIKADNMLVLEGPQGIGKSTLLRTLATLPCGDYFSDQANWHMLGDKDSRVDACWPLVLEMAELTGMRNREVETFKAFVSAQSFLGRLPYGRSPTQVHRHGVMAGTTNEKEYLTDTQNRRLWPLGCNGMIKLDVVKRNLEQYWAEAVFRHKRGDKHWLEADVEIIATQVQRTRVVTNPYESEILSYIFLDSMPPDRRESTDFAYGGHPLPMFPAGRQPLQTVCLEELYSQLGIDTARLNSFIGRTLSGILRTFGYDRKPYRRLYSPVMQYVSGGMYEVMEQGLARKGFGGREVHWFYLSEPAKLLSFL
jgi:hypothetical protein